MRKNSLEAIIAEMDILKMNFLNCRAYFPFMTEKHIGEQKIRTAPFYINYGFKIDFYFSEPLTEEHIEKNNQIGDWINQNFIVRVCAMLESHHIIPPINKSIEGWEEVDLTRRLRNIFVHSSGKFNPNNEKHRKLCKRLIMHFKLGSQNYQGFHIPIDEVCIPLFEGCRKYTQGIIAISS